MADIVVFKAGPIKRGVSSQQDRGHKLARRNKKDEKMHFLFHCFLSIKVTSNFVKKDLTFNDIQALSVVSKVANKIYRSWCKKYLYNHLLRNPKGRIIVDFYKKAHPIGTSLHVQLQFLFTLFDEVSITSIEEILTYFQYPSIRDVVECGKMLSFLLRKEIVWELLEAPVVDSVQGFDMWVLRNKEVIRKGLKGKELVFTRGITRVPLSFRVLGERGSLSLKVKKDSPFVWDNSQSVCLPCVGIVWFEAVVRACEMGLSPYVKKVRIYDPKSLSYIRSHPIQFGPPPNIQELGYPHFIHIDIKRYIDLKQLQKLQIWNESNLMPGNYIKRLRLEETCWKLAGLESVTIENYDGPMGLQRCSCPQMKELKFYECAAIERVDLRYFPSLEVFLYDCSLDYNKGRLKYLLGNPSCKVKRLEISGVEGEIVIDLAQFPLLESLHVEYCDEVQVVGVDAFIARRGRFYWTKCESLDSLFFDDEESI